MPNLIAKFFLREYVNKCTFFSMPADRFEIILSDWS